MAHLVRPVSLLAVVFALSLAVGCASSKPPAPSMDDPRTAVRQAEQAGAREYAPLELRAATKKMEEAEAAVEAGDTRKARLLVEKAEVDAQLAQAKALSAKSEAAVEELRETIQTLRDEIQRNERQR